MLQDMMNQLHSLHIVLVGETSTAALAVAPRWNTSWAFATTDQADALLFTALAKAAEQRRGDFKSQQLANTAWACATADQVDS